VICEATSVIVAKQICQVVSWLSHTSPHTIVCGCEFSDFDSGCGLIWWRRQDGSMVQGSMAVIDGKMGWFGYFGNVMQP
jgi:hypothetical protein